MQEMVIKGKRLRFVDEGRGFPILFGHSFLFDHAMWRPQLDELSKQYRVIAPDLFSHGASDMNPRENLSLSDIADDMWQLMQNLKLDRFAIMGLSIGGMWGARIAIEHPDNVAALGLFGTHLGSETPQRKIEYDGIMRALQSLGSFTEQFAEKLLPFFYCPNTFAEKKDLPARLKVSLVNTKSENIEGILAIGNAIFSRTSVLNDFHKIRCTSMVVVGQDDVARPPHESHEMAKLLNDCELHEVPHAGHISSLEQPEIITKLIFDVLSRAVST